MNSCLDMPDESVPCAEILHTSSAMGEVACKEGRNVLYLVDSGDVGPEALKRPTRKGALRAF